MVSDHLHRYHRHRRYRREHVDYSFHRHPRHHRYRQYYLFIVTTRIGALQFLLCQLVVVVQNWTFRRA